MRFIFFIIVPLVIQILRSSVLKCLDLIGKKSSIADMSSSYINFLTHSQGVCVYVCVCVCVMSAVCFSSGVYWYPLFYKSHSFFDKTILTCLTLIFVWISPYFRTFLLEMTSRKLELNSLVTFLLSLLK